MEQKLPGCASASRADDLTCQQVTALLVEYVNDALAPETMRAFQEHVVPPDLARGDADLVLGFSRALPPGHDALDLFSRSTDRLSRQNRIRELVLKSKERPNISFLARQFGVARRTIIRDLQELIRRGELAAELYPKWQSSDEEEGEDEASDG